MKNASQLFAGSLLAIASLAGTSAFAQNAIAYNDPQQAHGTNVAVSELSRAQVKAEFLQAQRNGTLPPQGEVTDSRVYDIASTASRATVRQDAVAAARQSALPFTDDDQAHGVTQSVS